MLLRNLQTIGGDIVNIRVKDGVIDDIGDVTAEDAGVVINFENAIVFPGLINSHDHLDFNLFPQLGNTRYSSYVEWSSDIHSRNKAAINNVLKVPKQLRAEWGIYKNLVSGITTVVNHGERLATRTDLISVFQQCHTLHSVRLEKNWKLKLNRPLMRKWPFAIHVGEGTDSGAHHEIDQLLQWNLFKREIIGVHGIAMNEQQATGLKALVWCPVSNYFLIGATAPIDKLKHLVAIMFGTDSTLSAGWNIWEHLRFARNENVVSDDDLYNMITTVPAETWKMSGCGSLEKGNSADIVIARKKKGMSGFEAFYGTDPDDILMVIHKGNARLFDAELLEQLSGDKGFMDDFGAININGYSKYVYGDLPGLMRQIERYYPEVSFPFEYKL